MSKEDLNQCYVQIASNDALGRTAKKLGFENVMVLGKSLQQNQAAKDRHLMLADGLEAIFGAIYVDGGIQGARVAVQRIFSEDFLKLMDTVKGKN